jgi:hypothetical protein
MSLQRKYREGYECLTPLFMTTPQASQLSSALRICWLYCLCHEPPFTPISARRDTKSAPWQAIRHQQGHAREVAGGRRLMTAAVPEEPAIQADADAYTAYVQRVADELVLSPRQLERLCPLLQNAKSPATESDRAAHPWRPDPRRRPGEASRSSCQSPSAPSRKLAERSPLTR